MAGSVRRRGKSWQAILSYRDPQRPTQVRQLTATRATKKDAEFALAELVVRLHAGRGAGTQTFAELVEKWVSVKRQTAAPSSLLRYDMALSKHLLPRFGDLRLKRITAEMLDDYYAQLRVAGMAANSIRWQHDLLSNIFRYALRTLRWIETSPAQDANPPSRTTTRIKLPTTDELARLVDAADVDGPVFGAFIRLAIVTGARRGELCVLQWKHLNLDAGQLIIAGTATLGHDGYIVKLPKNGRVRRIALDGHTIEHLSVYRDYRALLAEQCGRPLTSESFVFSCDSDCGTIGHPGTMTDKFSIAKCIAGVRDLRMHDLRHQAATVLLNRRVNPRVVAERLGHSRTSTTLDIYAQFVPAADDEAASILGELIRRDPSL
jgi:integrase